MFAFMLDSIERHGEYEARNYIQNEIERILKEQPELACNQFQIPDTDE